MLLEGWSRLISTVNNNSIASLSDWLFKVKKVKSQSYSKRSKVMRLRKVYFAPLPFLLGHSGCIYDSKNMKFNFYMNNLFNFNMS